MNIKLLFLLLPAFSFSQAPVVQWMHTRGGSASNYAKGVVQTSDGTLRPEEQPLMMEMCQDSTAT